jgi:small acid-soluble spore protein H (minor)
MKLKRAQEILQSEDSIQVSLQGTPVWIERVDEMNESVTIHYINDPDRSQEVAVTRIEE